MSLTIVLSRICRDLAFWKRIKYLRLKFSLKKPFSDSSWEYEKKAHSYQFYNKIVFGSC